MATITSRRCDSPDSPIVATAQAIAQRAESGQTAHLAFGATCQSPAGPSKEHIAKSLALHPTPVRCLTRRSLHHRGTAVDCTASSSSSVPARQIQDRICASLCTFPLLDLHFAIHSLPAHYATDFRGITAIPESGLRLSLGQIWRGRAAYQQGATCIENARPPPQASDLCRLI